MSKAYEKVPRSLLVALLQQRVPDTAVATATPIHQPLKMSTQKQKDSSPVAYIWRSTGRHTKPHSLQYIP